MPRGRPRLSTFLGYWDGPAIGKDEKQVRQQEDDAFASQLLREACLDLFVRTANRYQISMDDAMACHLGYHAPARIPGTERVIRGQAAERLAA